MHNSASAMKRSFEGNQSRELKRMKADLQEKKKADDIPQRHTFANNESLAHWKPTFFCDKDIDNCSYTTIFRRKIEEHHRLHNDQNAVTCSQACDFLGANERVIINHQTKWHKSTDSDNQEQVELTVKKLKCGYCGMQGNDLDGHMRKYHGKKFGRMRYNQNFSSKKISNDVE